MFRLYEVAKNESFLIGQLVRIAIGSITVATFEEGQKQGGWSDTHLAEWDNFLSPRKAPFKELERSLQFERVSTIYIMGSTINGTIGLLEGKDLAQSITQRPKKLWEKDMIFFDTQMKQLIEHARQASETGRVDENKSAALIDAAKSTAKRKRYVFTGMLLPAYGGTLQKEEKMLKRFSAARRR